MEVKIELYIKGGIRYDYILEIFQNLKTAMEVKIKIIYKRWDKI